MAIECLDMCVRQQSENKEESEDSDNSRKISFIVEQLELLTKRKYGRVYSPQLTILSYIIQSASMAACTALRDEDVLCLPSVTTLRKVTRHVHEDHGLDISAYLNLRVFKVERT